MPCLGRCHIAFGEFLIGSGVLFPAGIAKEGILVFAKGTLYYYFTHKAELLQVLREKFEDTVMESIQELDQACPPDDWHGRIRAWIEGATYTYFALNALHDVVIYGTNLPFRYAMADARITQYLAEILSQGNKAGA